MQSPALVKSYPAASFDNRADEGLCRRLTGRGFNALFHKFCAEGRFVFIAGIDGSNRFPCLYEAPNLLLNISYKCDHITYDFCV